MKALLQRVSDASVNVDGNCIGQIKQGLVVLLGIDKGDSEESARRLAEKVINYRVFADDMGKMNLSLLGKKAELLVVSQFTLSANTHKGLRPSFTTAAPPNEARILYELFVSCCREKVTKVETGSFAADMQVRLLNDGPVTFMLEV